MEKLPENRIDEIPIKWPAQEHLVSESLKKPPVPPVEETNGE